MRPIRLFVRNPRNQIWIFSSVATVAAVVLALGATWADVLVTDPPDIPTETLERFLVVIASSMLAVTTFSLGITVTAFASASVGATPRATDLVMADGGTQLALSSFLAAFIFSIVALVALALDLYEAAGRFMLFLITIGVIAYLVINLILWIRTLTQIGRLTDTLQRIESAGAEALRAHAQEPWLGAAPGQVDPPGRSLRGNECGFVTHLDLKTIETVASTAGCNVHVLVRPGAFVHPSSELLTIDGPTTPEDEFVLLHCIVIAATRSFEQDVRFAPIVLSEVAVRALASASNDQGTAIGVATVLTRLLTDYGNAVVANSPAPPRFPNVTIPSIDPGEFVRDGFEPIARNGVLQIELGIRLQKLLGVLRTSEVPQIADAAQEVADRAVERLIANVPFEADRAPILASTPTQRTT